MEFWGVEVKPNQTVRCEPGDEKLLRLSLAALGESKKTTENVVTYVTFHNQKLIIGTLSSEKCAQISHDLVFEKEFELSHSSKNASVYFIGYKVVSTDEVPSDFDDSESEEEEEVDDALKVKSNAEKVERKAKVKALKANMVEQDADDDDDSDDDDYGDNDGDDSDDEEMVEAEDSDDEDDEDDEDDDNDDDEDGNSEEDEETPKKTANGKKKPAEPVTKAVVSEKKAKLASPTDGGDAKKDSPTKSGKKQQTSKSSSSVSCKSCSKTFYSEGALDSHTKAKHAAK